MNFQTVHDITYTADRAGQEAARNAVVPQVHTDFDHTPMDGLCGGACIVVSGRTSFGRWVKANPTNLFFNLTGQDWWRYSKYQGGAVASPRIRSQSLERQLAYANAFARVLEENGIKGVRVQFWYD